MLSWGAEFRMWKPDRGRFAIMHAKSWVVDGSTALVGSVNFTNNGVDRSEELLAVIRDDACISKYMEWFEGLWAVATEVNMEMIREALAAPPPQRRK